MYPQEDDIEIVSKIVFDTQSPSKQELFTIKFLKHAFYYDGNYDFCFRDVVIKTSEQFKNIVNYINHSYPTADLVVFDFDDDKWRTFYNLMKIN